MMFYFAIFWFVVNIALSFGHNANKNTDLPLIEKEAIIQADLLPHELNPALKTPEDGYDPDEALREMGLDPRPYLSPRVRIRRNEPEATGLAQELSNGTGIAEKVKKYSRIVTCFVVVVSVVIEIVVYIMEAYQTQVVLQ